MKSTGFCKRFYAAKRNQKRAALQQRVARCRFLSIVPLHGPFHFAGPKTSCTDANMSRAVIDNGFYTLKIRLPGAFGANVRVADTHSCLNTFAAYCTGISHIMNLLHL